MALEGPVYGRWEDLWCPEKLKYCTSDIAWSRAHLRVISNWLNVSSDGNKQQSKSWLTSYGKVAMRFPVPTQM